MLWAYLSFIVLELLLEDTISSEEIGDKNIVFNFKIFQANGNKGRIDVRWQDEHKSSPVQWPDNKEWHTQSVIYLGAICNLFCESGSVLRKENLI